MEVYSVNFAVQVKPMRKSEAIERGYIKGDICDLMKEEGYLVLYPQGGVEWYQDSDFKFLFGKSKEESCQISKDYIQLLTDRIDDFLNKNTPEDIDEDTPIAKKCRRLFYLATYTLMNISIDFYYEDKKLKRDLDDQENQMTPKSSWWKRFLKKIGL